MPSVRASGRSRCRGCGWLLSLPLWAAALAPATLARAEPGPGFDEAAVLKTAAFRTSGAPSVIVHAPSGFDAQKPLHLVVYLHGYNGCVQVLMAPGPSRCKDGAPEREGWDLGRHHDAAQTNTLFVVPQLAFAQRNGDPGTFGKPNGFRSFLEELLGKTLVGRLGGPRKLKDVASLTLVAHSGAYQAALAIAENGGVGAKLKGLVLLDALYDKTDEFADLVERQAPRGLRFVSVYLEVGTPRRENQRLLQRLKRTLGGIVQPAEAADLARAVATKQIVIGQGRPPHRVLPEKHLAEILGALSQVYLPQRSAAIAAREH